jgi:UDP-perosamine 4-acetyltransferase
MSSLRYALIGAGGHARVVLAIAREAGMELAGVISADGAGSTGLEFLGGDDDLPDLVARGAVSGFIFGIGSVDRATMSRRAALFGRLEGILPPAPALVHSAASVAPSAVLGPGSVVCRGAIVGEGVVAGRSVIINTGAVIDHDARVGDHCHFGPGAVASGGVALGERVHVGAGAVVIQGVTAGVGALIGAGAVVVGDVEAGTTVLGVPARPHHAG